MLNVLFKYASARRAAGAFSERGYQLLMPYPPVHVKNHPDIRTRLEAFRGAFGGAFRQELSQLGVVLDSTQDLSRKFKVYGTSRPEVGVLSRFYGDGRVEDEALRAYLLEMKIPESQTSTWAGNSRIKMRDSLPEWLPTVLERDRELREPWDGVGKPGDITDTTKSGYDYSIVRRLLRLGDTDVAELATVLALQPGGGARDKGEAYIRRTIGNALMK